MIDQKCEGLTRIDTENSFQFDLDLLIDQGSIFSPFLSAGDEPFMRCGLQIDAVRPFAAPMLVSNTHSEGSYCEKALSFGVQTTCWALSRRYFCVDIRCGQQI